MKYDFFISYSRKDSAIVNEFSRHITDAGYSVWMDVDGIESGDEFKRKIASAIRDSKAFLFFSSAASNKSEWIVKEVNYAITKKKHIIPIKLDDADYNESVDFDLCAVDFIQCADTCDIKDAVGKLLRSLKSRIGVVSQRKVVESEEPVGIIEGNGNIPPGNFWDFFSSSTFKVGFRYLTVLSIVVFLGVAANSIMVVSDAPEPRAEMEVLEQKAEELEQEEYKRVQYLMDSLCNINEEYIAGEKILKENISDENKRDDAESKHNEDTKTVCVKCNGTGVELCQYCGGKGMLTETQFYGFDVVYVSIPCHYCLGSGISIPCRDCGGTGLIKEIDKPIL